ncbi:MAG: ankyrin repeat domain-containing protein [Alphaproteobacteria bacterium]|nr:ankyrin repeat domain-containing protein [Alphaproteobacteria bacterium]
MLKKTAVFIATMLYSTQIFGMQNVRVPKSEVSSAEIVKTRGIQTAEVLMNAIISNDVSKVDQLIAENVDINAAFDVVGMPSHRKFTPLMAAIGLGRKEIVENLLRQKNTRINAKNFFGFSALMDATLHNQVDIVKMLLNHPKIDVNVRGNNGSTALMFAAHKGHTIVLEQLLQHPKIDVNLQDDDGLTALIQAVQAGHTDIARILINHPLTDINKEANGRLTALRAAVNFENKEVIDLLLNTSECKR